MPERPHVFARPQDEVLLPLWVEPRLASWVSAATRNRKQLEMFLLHAIDLLRPAAEDLTDPLALRLDVAVPSGVSLIGQRDLDNYAFPLATRLAKETQRSIDCVWATKRHTPVSA